MSHSFKIAAAMICALLWGVQASAPASAQEHGRTEHPAPPAPPPHSPAPQSRPAGPPQARPPGSPQAPRPTYGRPAFDGRGQVLDGRYNHGRYYPPTGTVRPSLPDGYRPYYHGGNRYYFSGGSWYAPHGTGFVVIRPPPGVVIAVLPPYYSTVWFGGIPYYYADNVYYSQLPAQSGYTVVDPPEDADSPSPPPEDSPPDDLMIYPKNGQTKEQQAADQYECHNWAKGQSNFDPTDPSGGVLGNVDLARNNYNRAMAACLLGRGYQVN